MRQLRKAAGFPTLRFHDLRHTFITEAAEAGVPIRVTSSLVGQMSPEMTHRYEHIHTKAQEKAVRSIERRHIKLQKLLRSTTSGRSQMVQ